MLGRVFLSVVDDRVLATVLGPASDKISRMELKVRFSEDLSFVIRRADKVRSS